MPITFENVELARPFIRLNEMDFFFDGTPKKFALLRGQIKKNYCVHIPQILSEPLQDLVQSSLPHLRFTTTKYEVGHERLARGAHLAQMLNFTLSHPHFLKFISDLCETPPLRFFYGRIFRFYPLEEHHFCWHDDKKEMSRVVGLSISLNSTPHRGGEFQIREKRMRSRAVRIGNCRFGDGHLFLVNDKLEHRVTPVSGEFPRTNFAGWFHI